MLALTMHKLADYVAEHQVCTVHRKQTVSDDVLPSLRDGICAAGLLPHTPNQVQTLSSAAAS